MVIILSELFDLGFVFFIAPLDDLLSTTALFVFFSLFVTFLLNSVFGLGFDLGFVLLFLTNVFLLGLFDLF